MQQHFLCRATKKKGKKCDSEDVLELVFMILSIFTVLKTLINNTLLRNAHL